MTTKQKAIELSEKFEKEYMMKPYYICDTFSFVKNKKEHCPNNATIFLTNEIGYFQLCDSCYSSYNQRNQGT
jgi:hypothetical protein